MENRFGNKQYTVSGDDTIEKHIGDIVTGVIKRLSATIEPISIFLSGSLAKGEITAFISNNKIEIISDFEIGVVDWNWTKKARIKKIEQMLAIEYGIDLTLLFFLPRRFKKGIPLNWASPQSPLSIEQYELMKTTRFVYGKNLIENCYTVDFRDIPLWEAVRLLFNRMAELVGVLSADKTEDKNFFKACDKLLIACGDALLLNTGSYHHLYSQRKKLFEQRTGLIEEFCSKLSKEESIAIIDAYERKVYCKEHRGLSKNRLLIDTLCLSEKVFKDVIFCLMKTEFSSAEEFSEKYLKNPDLKKYSRTNPRLENIVNLLKNHKRIKPIPLAWFFRAVPVQHKIYTDVYLWLFGEYRTNLSKSGFDSFKNEKIIDKGKYVFESWQHVCL